MQNPVFLISLAKDTARRERLKERFSRYESFNLIEAVDGRVMSAKEYFALAMPSLRLHGRLLSPAEMGCALSHVKAYEAFIASEAEFGLFIEDDVIGDDSCVKFAFEMSQNLPKNSVLLCGCQDGLSARFSAFGKRVIDVRNFNENTKFSLPVALKDKDCSLFLVSPISHGTICRTAAYILSKESAKRLLQVQKSILSTSDLWEYLLKKCELNMYFSDIFVHPEDMTDSNINAERDERGYARLNLAGLMRSVRYIVATRLQSVFGGYERIFKRD